MSEQTKGGRTGLQTSEGKFSLLLLVIAGLVLAAPYITDKLPDNFWVVQVMSIFMAGANTSEAR